MKQLNFDKPLMMGIVNLTPDSFFDGGKFLEGEDDCIEGEDDHPRLQNIFNRIDDLINQGADIIDIGAESTFGPESQVKAEEEWGRLEPVLSQIDYSQVFVSVDTYKAEVAERALNVKMTRRGAPRRASTGVQMINDVTALRGDPRMIDVLLKYQSYVCLMFSADETPYASRTNHQYKDVIKTVSAFLKEQTGKLIQAGFPRDRIIVDPGLGFFLSSDPAVSWEVIERLDELKALGFPILIGPSMKSFLGGEISERGQRSLDAAQKCIEKGANVVRMHEIES